MQRRHISWRRLFTRHFIWAPLIPALIALITGAIASHQLRTAELLDIYGIEATATITARDIRRSRDSEGNERVEYYVTARFQPATGPEVTTRHSVSRTRFEALPPGTETPLRYVGHDPAISEIEPGRAALTGRILGWLAAAGMVVALGIAFWVGRRKASLFRAARRGEVRQARVTGRVVTNTRINGHRQYRLTWTDAAGSAGRSGLFRAEVLPPEGSVIVVYVDGRSGRGWWEEEL